MRKLLALVAVCALLASVGAFGATLASGSGSPVANRATHTVRVGDNFFSPTRKTIRRGGTLRFTWVGDNSHNVTTLTGRTLISTRTSGAKSVRFYRTRRLLCTIHPDSMRFKVIVD
jgi:plastocyanin